jgi:hypothetical protein
VEVLRQGVWLHQEGEAMTENTDEIQLYEAADGWRWTRRDGGNHTITGTSSEAYTSKGAALENITTTQREPYVIIDETTS